MWNSPFKDEEDLMNRLMALPYEEFQERMIAIQEVIMMDLLDKKFEEGKIVFYEVENGLLN